MACATYNFESNFVPPPSPFAVGKKKDPPEEVNCFQHRRSAFIIAIITYEPLFVL